MPSDSNSCRPDVAVIIPTYNCWEHLGDAITSIGQQGQARCETVVVDDCSDKAVSKIDGAVVIRNDDNIGPAGSRNRGVAISSAKYISFLDSDDAWIPGKLSAQIAVLDKNPEIVGVCGEMVHWNSPIPPAIEPCSCFETWELSDLIQRNAVATPTVVVRREALLAAGGFDETLRLCEDYDLWLRLARIGPFARICSPLARYRTRQEGLSAGNRMYTHQRYLEYIASIPNRFPEVPNVKRLTRKHLAYAHFSHSCIAIDEIADSRLALQEIIRSLCCWPIKLGAVYGNVPRLKRTTYLAYRWITGN
jgi:glycosyltransferase involved in cell wall biosynthesis